MDGILTTALDSVTDPAGRECDTNIQAKKSWEMSENVIRTYFWCVKMIELLFTRENPKKGWSEKQNFKGQYLISRAHWRRKDM